MENPELAAAADEYESRTGTAEIRARAQWIVSGVARGEGVGSPDQLRTARALAVLIAKLEDSSGVTFKFEIHGDTIQIVNRFGLLLEVRPVAAKWWTTAAQQHTPGETWAWRSFAGAVWHALGQLVREELEADAARIGEVARPYSRGGGQ